ncbi:signal peptidase I [Halobaculum sp. CBA1158]|uniref:signal peptidase I n=1 Tax=Halobaculum sp. CBA1158 TaxID=2904243 RepID=UPI001F20395A|nr:signal peptidase I [Halobaculum sp. CBA1158]UIO99189.1 signal peptidase I [Halobaculum sp. CBA1158]
MNRDAARTIGAILLIVAVAPFAVFAVPQAAGASHSYVVLSDSMSPEIRAGDVVIVDDADPATIGEGDVITYERPGGSQLITHRVVEVVDDGERRFRTKGDANEEPDPAPVPPDNVVGVVAFHIPLIGHVISFGSSDLGIVAFVIVPSVLLAVGEVYDLYRDATADTSGDGGDD